MANAEVWDGDLGEFCCSGKKLQRRFGCLFTKAQIAQVGLGAVFIVTVAMLRIDEEKGSRDDLPKHRSFCKEGKFLEVDS